MYEIEIERVLEELAGQMRSCSDAGRAIAVFARVRLYQRNELLYRFRRNGGMDRQHMHGGGGNADRLEIGDRVVGHFLVETGIRGKSNAVDKENGIPVWRGLRRAPRADIAARTRHVLDVKLLLEMLR